MFNYIGYLNKPNAVNKSITGYFTGNVLKNLILVKSSYLEIYLINDNSIDFLFSQNIYCEILILENINSENKSIERLFVLNNLLEFSVIEFNENRKIFTTITNGSIKEEINLKKKEIIFAKENNSEFIIISAYKNIFNVIFLKEKNNIFRNNFKIKFYLEGLSDLINFNPHFDEKELLSNDFIEKDKFEFPKFYENIFDNFSYQIKNDNEKLKENAKYLFTKKYMNSMFEKNKINSLFAFFCKQEANENYEKNFINFEIIPFILDLNERKFILLSEIKISIKSKITDNLNFFVYSPYCGGLIIITKYIIDYLPVSYYKEFNSYSLIKTKEIISEQNLKKSNFSKINGDNYIIFDDKGNFYIINIENIFFYYNQIITWNKLKVIFFNCENQISCFSYLGENKIFYGSEVSKNFILKINKNIRDSNKIFELIDEYENFAPIKNFIVFEKINNKFQNSLNKTIIFVTGKDNFTALNSLTTGCSFNECFDFSFFPCYKFFKVNVFGFHYCDNENTQSTIEKKTIHEYSKLLIFYSKQNIEIFTLGKNRKSLNKQEKSKLPFEFKENSEILLITKVNFLGDNLILLITSKKIQFFDEYLNKISEFVFKYELVNFKLEKKIKKLIIYDSTDNLRIYDFETIFSFKKKINFKPKEINDCFEDLILNMKNISNFELFGKDLFFNVFDKQSLFIFYSSKKEIREINILDIKFQKSQKYVNDEADFITDILKYKEENENEHIIINLAKGANFFISKNNIKDKKDEEYLFKYFKFSNENYSLFKFKFNKKEYLFTDTNPNLIISYSEGSIFISNLNKGYFNEIYNISSNLFLLKNKNKNIYLIADHLNFNEKFFLRKITNKSIDNLTYIDSLNVIIYSSIEDNLFFPQISIIDNNFNKLSKYIFECPLHLINCLSTINWVPEFFDNFKEKAIVILSLTDNLRRENQNRLVFIEISNEYKLTKICEIEIPYFISKFCISDEMLFISHINSISIYKISFVYTNQFNKSLPNYELNLRKIQQINDFFIILDISFKNNFILVTDANKYIHLYQYNREKNCLTKILKENYPNLCVSSQIINNNIFFIADIFGNLSLLRKNTFKDEETENHKYYITQFLI